MICEMPHQQKAASATGSLCAFTARQPSMWDGGYTDVFDCLPSEACSILQLFLVVQKPSSKVNAGGEVLPTLSFKTFVKPPGYTAPLFGSDCHVSEPLRAAGIGTERFVAPVLLNFGDRHQRA